LNGAITSFIATYPDSSDADAKHDHRVPKSDLRSPKHIRRFASNKPRGMCHRECGVVLPFATATSAFASLWRSPSVLSGSRKAFTPRWRIVRSTPRRRRSTVHPWRNERQSMVFFTPTRSNANTQLKQRNWLHRLGSGSSKKAVCQNGGPYVPGGCLTPAFAPLKVRSTYLANSRSLICWA